MAGQSAADGRGGLGHDVMHGLGGSGQNAAKHGESGTSPQPR